MLEESKKYLGKIVKVVMDRPLATTHPEHGFIYMLNYGYNPNTVTPDGEELDAYVLKIDKPLDKFTGRVVAIIHRINDDDDNLIVIPDGQSITDNEIEKLTEFQEKWFKHEIVR